MVEKIEGLLAGPRNPWNGVAVTQREAELYIDLLGCLSRNPVGAKPVVLIGFHYVANLECVDGSIELVHLGDGVPLKKKYKKVEKLEYELKRETEIK